MFLAYFLYGLADIIIELGTAMMVMAAGAIGFLIGHIVFIIGIAKSKKVQTESDLPYPASKCVRIVLSVVFCLIFVTVTVIAIRIITAHSNDVAIIAVCVIYPASFAVMSVVALFSWRHKSSLILNQSCRTSSL